jgi:hypothetical protein
MTKLDQFTEIMEKLEVAFGVIEDGKVKLYYDRLKKFEPWALKKAVNKILDECDDFKFPKIARIYSEASAFQKDLEKDYIKPTYCNRCNCTGFVFQTIKKGEIERDVVYRCSCPNGDKKSKKIRSIKSLEAELGADLAGSAEGKLFKAEYKELLEDPAKNFRGIVQFECEKCGGPYTLEFKKETPVKKIIEIHEGCLGPYNLEIDHLCDICRYEKGREIGLWE